MLPKTYLYLLAYLLAIASLPAQNIGEPVVLNYYAKEYGAVAVSDLPFSQDVKQDIKRGLVASWGVAQAENGKMYFATGSGVLEFDGQTWNIIPIVHTFTENSAARSIHYDKQTQRIYIGGHDNFGYIEQQKSGKRVFVSLYDKFKAQITKKMNRAIGEVWSVQIHKREVYFHTRFGIFIYDGKSLRITPLQDSYHRFFLIGQKLYVRQDKVGFCRFENDQAVPIKFGEMFAPSPNFQISGLLPHYKGSLLMGTRREGLFFYGEYGETKEEVFNKKGISPEVDARLKEAQIYCMKQLANGNIAIGTLRNGLFILDRDLQILHHLNEANGLQNNSILAMTQDKDDQIWVGTFNGIAKILLNTNYARLTEKNGVVGAFGPPVRFQNDIYVTSNLGVFKFDKKSNQFKIVEGILAQAFSLQILNVEGKDRLFAGSDNLYEFVNGKFVPLLEFSGRRAIFGFFNDPNSKNTIYYTSDENVMIAQYKNGKCETVGKLKDLKLSPNRSSMVLDSMSNMWILDRSKLDTELLVHYSLKEQKILQKFSKKDFAGLENISLQQPLFLFLTRDFDGNLLFDAQHKLYVYNPETQTFKRDLLYKKSRNLPDSASFYYAKIDDKQGFLVANTQDNQWHIIQKFDNNKVTKIDSLPIRFFYEHNYNINYEYEEDRVWAMSDKEVVINELKTSKNYYKTFPTYIRTVRPLMNCDSLFAYEVFGESDKSFWVLPYYQNALRFEFSAVDLAGKDKMRYSYYLENFSTGWSSWSIEAYKEYTNLPEGTYTFHVRAKNYDGFVGQKASFTFTILAPWYRTWWAYTLYAVVAGLVLYGLVYWNLKRLRQYNEYLTRLVRERTREIEEQNQEILAQAEELRQFNDEILAHKEEIEAQRDLLEKQNHEVMDSINYGSRIQNAILPFRDRIEKTLDEHFVLFQPRDVVSGDFYWFHDTNPEDRAVGKAIIAVADCTGHGVPGAFMSMIGNQILYELVIQKYCADSDIILNMLHKEVRRTLRQYETENRDGMDIGVVVWDKEKHLLEFSGAKNTLVYFLQGEMMTIRGDKMPIGGEQREEERIFTKHLINLPTNGEKLTFYLFSDGFQDQFGGANNKKFSPQRMRDLFRQIHALPMAEQEYTLLHTITQWRNEGQERQTDDILVWGTRL